MLSGDTALVKYPSKGFPYVPGLDVCGQVVEAVPPFAVGDWVVATWGDAFGAGGAAEYSVVDPALTVPKPEGLDCVGAAALANSAGHALMALRAAKVQPGDRVLVLGGSGGVGTAMVQLARTAEFGASYVAATSTDVGLLASLGVDRPIDYSQEDWSRLDEFVARPFDVIIDCAEGVAAWRRVRDGSGVLRAGGRFVAVVLNEWHIQMTRWWHLPAFLLPPLGRMLRSRLGRTRYAMYVGTLDGSVLAELLRLAEGGQLRPVVDPEGPYPLSTDGAVAAFERLASRRAKGKVVVAISAPQSTDRGEGAEGGNVSGEA